MLDRERHTHTHLHKEKLLSSLQFLPADGAGETGEVVDLVHCPPNHILRAEACLTPRTLGAIQPTVTSIHTHTNTLRVYVAKYLVRKSQF